MGRIADVRCGLNERLRLCEMRLSIRNSNEDATSCENEVVVSLEMYMQGPQIKVKLLHGSRA